MWSLPTRKKIRDEILNFFKKASESLHGMYIIKILFNYIGGLYSTKNGLRIEINYREKMG